MTPKFKDKYRQSYRNILKILPTKVVLNIENLRGYHKFVNFKNPRYFGEKIQWLKLYGNLEKYSDYVDKYKVREYIKKTIGEEYLIPLLGVYDKIEDINYESFPHKFVLKLNTGSGYNIIVNDKNKININDINIKLKKWLEEDYYKIKKEPQYKNIKKKILCEKYICDKECQLLDYKFFCFNGVPKFIEVDFDRFANHTMNFYDIDWNLLKLNKGDYQNYYNHVEKPEKFNEMVKIVEKLCKNFNFVRVDLYNVDGKIYFGELTFTPAGGLTPFKPIEKDIEISKMFDLKRGI